MKHEQQPFPRNGERKHGKRLLAQLEAQGIRAGSVIRNRRTGVYAVEFDAPNVTDTTSPGTDPAALWAKRIQDRFDGVEIVEAIDNVAEWRPHRPILFATVYLRGEPIPKAS